MLDLYVKKLEANKILWTSEHPNHRANFGCLWIGVYLMQKTHLGNTIPMICPSSKLASLNQTVRFINFIGGYLSPMNPVELIVCWVSTMLPSRFICIQQTSIRRHFLLDLKEHQYFVHHKYMLCLWLWCPPPHIICLSFNLYVCSVSPFQDLVNYQNIKSLI